MISLHKRLAFIIDVTNSLAAQRCELEQLRKEVGEAELRDLGCAQAAAALGSNERRPGRSEDTRAN